jgi:hypothetical protein
LWRIGASEGVSIDSHKFPFTPALLLQTVCCNVKFDTPPCSTSLAPEYVAQEVTAAELKQHTFTGTKTASEARKQCKKK